MKKFSSTIVMSLIAITLNAQTTIVLQPGSQDGKDAWIWSYDPFENINFGETNSSNFGLNNVIRSEVWIWDNVTQVSDTIRGILDFDLSQIPTNSMITEAKLSLYYFVNTGYTQQIGENEMLIQRVTQDWSETAITWNNKPNTTEVNQQTITRSTSNTQDYLDLNVTALVQDMVDSSSNSFGFMLKMLNEVTFKGLTFASSEHPDTSLHPKLEITYNTLAGINDANKTDKVFTAYPNPAKEFIIVKFNDILPSNISIVDINGKLVKSQKINSKKTTIDIKDLAAATYLIKTNINGKEFSRRFVKKHVYN